ncbi:MAG: hypothetical protein SW833_13705 [Cyanobacteriota bacterium]|nr:hypothetical protein [Cyanobacteriota bacterium]
MLGSYHDLALSIAACPRETNDVDYLTIPFQELQLSSNGQLAMGSWQWASWQWAVGSGQWAMGSGQWAMGSWQK